MTQVVEIRCRDSTGTKFDYPQLDSSKNLKVSLATALDSSTDSVTSTIVPAATIGHGRTTVTPAYTITQLYSTPTSCQWITIQAARSNTGFIAIGTSPGVTATPGASYGVVLESLDTYTLNGDLADIYINGTVTNDAVTYTYGV